MDRCAPLFLLQQERRDEQPSREWYEYRMIILSPYLNLDWNRVMKDYKETDYYLYTRALYIYMYSMLMQWNFLQERDFPLETYDSILLLLEDTLCYYDQNYIQTGQDTIRLFDSLI
jgi:hypothetical protein